MRVRWIATALAVVAVAGHRAGAQARPDTAGARLQRTIDSLSAALRDLQGRVDAVERAPAAAAPRASGAYMNVSFVGLTDFGWSSAPDIKALQPGDHDPHVRGFTLPNGEIALDGAVDPYFKAFVNIVHKLDTSAETGTELEEMYLLTSSLPANLQIKLGQFFAEFGRQNNQHPHAWGFADEPLVLNRMFGPDGLRSQGVRASWLVPAPFFMEASLAVMNSAGGTAYSFRNDESSAIHGGAAVSRDVGNLGDLLYVPRLSTSFDLTDNQTLVAGASAALGPNSGGVKTRTSVFGADVYWKWKSPSANQGFPFVSFQSEWLTRKYDVDQRTSLADSVGPALPGGTIEDDGAYAQVLWGIQPRIVAGIRGEYVHTPAAQIVTPDRINRTRWSPNLTWYPTEFSKIRLQYNYDHRAGIGSDHSVWMQFEFLLGAHAAHKF